MTKRIIAVAVMMIGGLLTSACCSATGGAIATTGENLDSRLLMWNGKKMAPGTEYGLVIKKIDVARNRLVVQYDRQAGDENKKLNRVNIVWGEKGDQLGYLLGGGRPYWATTAYNNSTLYGRKFLSGQEEILEGKDLENDLSQNNTHQLFYATSYSVTGQLDGLHRYNKIDYSDCMAVYQPGVECIAERGETGTLIYRPYLNGELMAVPEEEIQPVEEPEAAILAVADANQGKIIENQGKIAGNQGKITKDQEKVADVMTAQTEVAGLAPRVPINEQQEKNERESNIRGQKQKDEVKKVKNQQARPKTVTEVPKAGKKGSSKMTGWGIGGLVIMGVSLLIWWFVPLKRRKKDEDEA